MNPKLKPAGMITLVNKASTTVYSGMFPGVIAGKYKIDEILIDLRKLALKAGVSFVMAEIEGINLKEKKLLLAGRPEIEYSLLSLNIGTKTNINSKLFIRGDKDLAVPIKPFSESYKFIVDQDIQSGFNILTFELPQISSVLLNSFKSGSTTFTRANAQGLLIIIFPISVSLYLIISFSDNSPSTF